MTVLHKMKNYEHEKLIFCNDKEVGLKAIIGIHNTNLGPALGGTRMYNYNKEEDAIEDVLRLSKGMTYKAAAVDLNLGGGKAVIIGDPKYKSEKLWRAYGKAINKLNGLYITAEDVGTSVDDMEVVAKETEYVVGLKDKSGDPSPATAFGTFKGIQAAMGKIWGNESLENKVVVVQGVGNVGYHLCKHLFESGAKLVVTDLNTENLERVKNEFFADYVEPEEIFDVEADIFSPCAMGGIVNSKTIPRLNVSLIAGAANNQLEDEEKDARFLEERKISYVPDFVINAGGLINVAEEGELKGYNYREAMAKIVNIYKNVKTILDISRKENITTTEAAYFMAEKRLQKLNKSQEVIK